jgi:hypothetical protein
MIKKFRPLFIKKSQKYNRDFKFSLTKVLRKGYENIFVSFFFRIINLRNNRTVPTPGLKVPRRKVLKRIFKSEKIQGKIQGKKKKLSKTNGKNFSTDFI